MMKFDHIVMNPPYDGNLHLKVVQEAMKHSDDVVNLSPANFLENLGFYAGWNKDGLIDNILPRCESVEIIPHREANDIFGLGNQIGCLGIYKITEKNHGRSIKDYFNDFDIKLMTMSYSMKPSLWSKYKKKKDSKPPYVNVYKWHEDTTSPEYSILVPVENGNNSYVIPFKTEEECTNFKNSLKTKLMRYIIGKLHEINPAHLPYLGDYTHPWDDAALYKYFGLTQEEISLIEEEMK